MLQFRLDDAWVWVWLASVWGGGWLCAKALLLHPHFLDYIFGDMSDGDRRALTLVFGVAVFVFVHSVFFETPFFDITPLLGVDQNGEVPLFWTGPVSLVVGLAVLALAHAVEKVSKYARMLASKILQKKIYGKHAKYLAGKNAIFDFVKKADDRQDMAMLTLGNRKVYIGLPRRVSDWNNPRPSNQHLYFLPVLSGYRKKDSLKLKITTSYGEAYLKSIAKGGLDNAKKVRARMKAKISEWEIIVPVNEIIHAQPFDPDVYKEMQRAKREIKRNRRRKKPPKK